MKAGLSIISLFQSKPSFMWKKTDVERVAVPLGEKKKYTSIALDKVEIHCVQTLLKSYTWKG